MRSPATFLVLVPLLAGCGGVFPDNVKHAEAARASIGQRASFDLGCKDVVVQQLTDTSRLGGQATTSAFGVTGCNHKASYTVLCVSNWGKISCTPTLDAKE
jgi:hypothetical protein